MAFALAVTAVLSAVTRKPFFRIAAPVAVYVVLFFSYGTIKQLWPSNSKPEFIFLGWSGLVLLACALAWLASRHPKARGGIFAGLLVLVALPAAGLLKYLHSGAAAASADRMEFLHSIAFRQKPNVYFMILDAYGRADTLKLALGFDNERFLGELERLGFFIPRHSVSNYPATNASVGSMLSLDYPEAAKKLEPACSRIPARTAGSQSGRRKIQGGRLQIHPGARRYLDQDKLWRRRRPVPRKDASAGDGTGPDVAYPHPDTPAAPPSAAPFHDGLLRRRAIISSLTMFSACLAVRCVRCNARFS